MRLIRPIVFFLLISIGVIPFYPVYGQYGQTVSQGTGFEFLTSWRAATLVPDTYRGKALPAQNAYLTVSFELFKNGLPVNLTGEQVRWYVNDSLLTNTPGTQSISYSVQTPGGQTETIRIQIPDYNGQLLETVVAIPVARPKIAIVSTLPDQQVPSGDAVLHAIPYFFSTQNFADLLFSWKVNDQSPTGSPTAPDFLTVTTPRIVSGNETLSVFAAAQNKNNDTEIATKTTYFSVINQ